MTNDHHFVKISAHSLLHKNQKRLFFYNCDHEPDDWFKEAQLPVKIVSERGSEIGGDEGIMTIALFVDRISQAAFSPDVQFLNCTSSGGDPALDLLDDTFERCLIKFRINDQNYFIITHFGNLLSTGLPLEFIVDEAWSGKAAESLLLTRGVFYHN
jgi:hypothetical protein